MFFHQHPYPPFIPKNTNRLIVGTLPPPRFSKNELLEGDIDFCYGSKNGQLWKILDEVFQLNLEYKTSKKAIDQRKDFLRAQQLGICDIVESCYRQKIDASDLGMEDIKLRDLLFYLKKHVTVNTLLFTGGSSKNGPEYFFRKLLKEHGLKYELISNEVPRVHVFRLGNRKIETVSLTAPSGSANRAVGSMEAYKLIKAHDPNFNTFEFRVRQYREIFQNFNYL